MRLSEICFGVGVSGLVFSKMIGVNGLGCSRLCVFLFIFMDSCRVRWFVFVDCVSKGSVDLRLNVLRFRLKVW